MMVSKEMIEMKIEVWSDYVCPFCYIGKRRLEEAIAQAGVGEDIEIVYKAYELDPNSLADSDRSMVEVLAEKYNVSVDEAKAMTDNVAMQAETVGLQYDFGKMTPANTFQAHRLAKLAEAKGLGEEATERLLKAYFIEGQKIGTRNILLELAKEIGLAVDEVETMLDSDAYIEDVKKDIQEAGQIGVQGVPFFVIDRKYAISGAQPTETFVDALEKAASEA